MKYQNVREERIAITVPSSMDEYHKEIISDPNKYILFHLFKVLKLAKRINCDIFRLMVTL